MNFIMRTIGKVTLAASFLLTLSNCRMTNTQTKRGLVGGQPVSTLTEVSDFFVELFLAEPVRDAPPKITPAAGVLIGDRYVLTYAHPLFLANERWRDIRKWDLQIVMRVTTSPSKDVIPLELSFIIEANDDQARLAILKMKEPHHSSQSTPIAICTEEQETLAKQSGMGEKKMLGIERTYGPFDETGHRDIKEELVSVNVLDVTLAGAGEDILSVTGVTSEGVAGVAYLEYSDAGAPLVFYGNGVNYPCLLGIATHQANCGPKSFCKLTEETAPSTSSSSETCFKLSLFTRVVHIRDSIYAITELKQSGTSGGSGPQDEPIAGSPQFSETSVEDIGSCSSGGGNTALYCSFTNLHQLTDETLIEQIGPAYSDSSSDEEPVEELVVPDVIVTGPGPSSGMLGSIAEEGEEGSPSEEEQSVPLRDSKSKMRNIHNIRVPQTVFEASNENSLKSSSSRKSSIEVPHDSPGPSRIISTVARPNRSPPTVSGGPQRVGAPIAKVGERCFITFIDCLHRFNQGAGCVGYTTDSWQASTRLP